MIDYIMGSGSTKDRIREMRIGCTMESDHQPVMVRIKGKKD